MGDAEPQYKSQPSIGNQQEPAWVNIIANQVQQEKGLVEDKDQDMVASNEPHNVIDKSQKKEHRHLRGRDVDLESQKKQPTTRFGKKMAEYKTKSGGWYKELIAKETWSAVIAEMLGQGFLCYMIWLVVYTTKQYGGNALATSIVISIGHGLTFGISFMIFFPLSGCQMNAAVTIGLWSMGKLTSIRAFLTIIFQFIGSLIAGGMAFWSQQKQYRHDITQNGGNSTTNTFGNIFAAEFVGTFIFMTSIIANAVDSRSMNYKAAAWQIGATLAFLTYICSNTSTSSFNPFRTFTISLLSNNYDATWAFIIADILGALASVFFYNFLFFDPEAEKDKTQFYKQQQHSKKVENMLTYFKSSSNIPRGLVQLKELQVKDWYMGERHIDGRHHIPLQRSKLYVIEFFTTQLNSFNFTPRLLNDLLYSVNGQNYKLKNDEDSGYLLTVFGITYDRPKRIRQWISEVKPKYLIGRDEDGQATMKQLQLLGIKYLPTCIVVKDDFVIWMGNSANPELPRFVHNEVAKIQNPNSNNNNNNYSNQNNSNQNNSQQVFYDV